MPIVASIVTGFATEMGLIAASVAVGGFLAHVVPALKGAEDARLRFATVLGGLGGLVLVAGVNLFALLFS